jgi:cysteine desulfurase / selenocysteine lyase
MYDINALRQNEFPHSQNQIYFNHAAISPLPQRTRRKMNWVVDQLADNPSRFWVEEGLPMTESLKASLASLINAADPEEIVPITTTSAGINALAQSINWNLQEDNIFLRGGVPFECLSLAQFGRPARAGSAAGNGR